jgi:hypothetical protein
VQRQLHHTGRLLFASRIEIIRYGGNLSEHSRQSVEDGSVPPSSTSAYNRPRPSRERGDATLRGVWITSTLILDVHRSGR